MIAAPKPKTPARRSLFPTTGSRHKRLPLLEAVYYNRTEQALAIIEADPAQINLQDPFAGLSPLHVAVFRQNLQIVVALTRHPITDIGLADRFGRKAIDMCLYTLNDDIFQAVAARTYQKALIQLDTDDGDKIRPLR